jgi:geranylgeranyl transferase type-2 subunit beta
MTAHLRMNAVYWGVTALCIMKHKDALDAEETIEYVMSCWDDEAGTPRLLPRCLSVRSADTMNDRPRRIRRAPRTRRTHPLDAQRDPGPRNTRCPGAHRRTARDRLYVPPLPPRPPIHAPSSALPATVILGLQQPSGIFAGDAFGETDTRFLYCAVSALSLLGALDRLDRARTVAYLAECRNFDGGFGRIAGAESHAAQGACWVLHPLTLLTKPCLRLVSARSVGVHGCTCDPRSIGRDRRIDARMVACGAAVAQRGAKRAP